MADLSRLGIGLTVFFALSLFALFAELCYIFIRRRNKSKVEPAGGAAAAQAESHNVAVDEVEKWQEMHGPLRGLFTIKEEEKEDMESEKSCSGRKMVRRGCLGDEEEENVVVVLGFERESETPYYTPFSSPPREGEEKMVKVVGSEGCFIVEVEAERGFQARNKKDGLDR